VTKEILSSTSATVYFDNCLVGALVKADHPAEMPALVALMREHAAGKLSLVASTEVLGEIERLPSKYQGAHLGVWTQLKRLPAANVSWVDEAVTPPIQAIDPDYKALRGILPDETDRRHVLHAIRSRVDYFATVDRDTILKHRGRLEAVFSIRFGTPAEIAAALMIVTT
jgi:hypothetical protein